MSEQRTHGLVQIGVRTRGANDTFREEALLISAIEWRLDQGGLRACICAMIDKAAEAAMKAERQATYAAGPKGDVP